MWPQCTSAAFLLWNLQHLVLYITVLYITVLYIGYTKLYLIPCTHLLTLHACIKKENYFSWTHADLDLFSRDQLIISRWNSYDDRPSGWDKIFYSSFLFSLFIEAQCGSFITHLLSILYILYILFVPLHPIQLSNCFTDCIFHAFFKKCIWIWTRV